MTRGWRASIFCSPQKGEGENEDQRSGFPNDDLTHLLGVPAARVPMVVPPWPSGTRALEQREILASWPLKTATKPPENRGQFAVGLLKKVIELISEKIYVRKILDSYFNNKITKECISLNLLYYLC